MTHDAVENQNVLDYVPKMWSQFERYWKEARQNLLEAKKAQPQWYDKQAHQRMFKSLTRKVIEEEHSEVVMEAWKHPGSILPRCQS